VGKKRSNQTARKEKNPTTTSMGPVPVVSREEATSSKEEAKI
jgi:hypothetical protein